MPKYKRIKQKILLFLDTEGKKNTQQIYDHVNERGEGIQMMALVNVLSKHPLIESKDTVRIKGVSHQTYESKVWQIKELDSQQ